MSQSQRMIMNSSPASTSIDQSNGSHSDVERRSGRSQPGHCLGGSTSSNTATKITDSSTQQATANRHVLYHLAACKLGGSGSSGTGASRNRAKFPSATKTMKAPIATKRSTPAIFPMEEAHA